MDANPPTDTRTPSEIGSQLADQVGAAADRVHQEQRAGKSLDLIAAENAMLEAFFTYHPPTDEDIVHYQAVNDAALALAKVIMEHCPSCAATVLSFLEREEVHTGRVERGLP